jgi:hypothetical protein
MLTREEFLKGSDLKREEVEIPGGGKVLMRELTVGERLDCRKRWLSRNGDGDDETLSIAFVAVSICEPAGEPMFRADEIDLAVDLIKKKSLRTVEALQGAFVRMNGLTDEAVSEAVKNSTEIPSASSSSGSPVISDTPQQGP